MFRTLALTYVSAKWPNTNAVSSQVLNNLSNWLNIVPKVEIYFTILQHHRTEKLQVKILLTKRPCICKTQHTFLIKIKWEFDVQMSVFFGLLGLRKRVSNHVCRGLSRAYQGEVWGRRVWLRKHINLYDQFLLTPEGTTFHQWNPNLHEALPVTGDNTHISTPGKATLGSLAGLDAFWDLESVTQLASTLYFINKTSEGKSYKEISESFFFLSSRCSWFPRVEPSDPTQL